MTIALMKAEPVQEPVAWMYTGIKSDGSEHGPHLVWKPAYMDAMSADKGAKATPLYAAPAQRKPLTEQEPQCNPHSRAPHGFMRNASHTENRYVCECEAWDPWEAGYQAGMESALKLQEAEDAEPCRYPDCVDNGPDGKCTRWLLDECGGPPGARE